MLPKNCMYVNVHNSTTHVQLRCQGSGSMDRARQHCIARHWTRHEVFLPVPFTPKADPQLWVSSNLSHHTISVGPLLRCLTWRSCTELSLRHTVQRNWFMPLSDHQQIPMARILYHPSAYLAFSTSPTRFTINVHKSITHRQLRCQGSGSIGQLFPSCVVEWCNAHWIWTFR